MKQKPSEEYLERAGKLTRLEAEHMFSRMRGKIARRVEDRKVDPIEAIAIQLELEDEELNEWRERWNEISEREKSRSEKRR